MKRAISLAIVPIAALAIAGCGGGKDNSSMPGHSMSGHPMGGSSAPGRNAQDTMFAQMMIPHHRQAITMARQAATRASSPEVKKLARQIEQAQDPEIKKMSGWLRSWGDPMSAGHMGMGHGDGMMSDKDMKKLGTLSGASFDREFLRMMIEHHQGAVTMARTEQASGSFADAKALAGSIVTTQTAEIATMRKLLRQM